MLLQARLEQLKVRCVAEPSEGWRKINHLFISQEEKVKRLVAWSMTNLKGSRNEVIKVIFK